MDAERKTKFLDAELYILPQAKHAVITSEGFRQAEEEQMGGTEWERRGYTAY